MLPNRRGGKIIFILMVYTYIDLLEQECQKSTMSALQNNSDLLSKGNNFLKLLNIYALTCSWIKGGGTSV